MYYPCSENKGVDQLRSYCEADLQLRSYCEADLRLCFCLCRLLVFPCGGSYFFRCWTGLSGDVVMNYIGDRQPTFFVYDLDSDGHFHQVSSLYYTIVGEQVEVVSYIFILSVSYCSLSLLLNIIFLNCFECF